MQGLFPGKSLGLEQEHICKSHILCGFDDSANNSQIATVIVLLNILPLFYMSNEWWLQDVLPWVLVFQEHLCDPVKRKSAFNIWGTLTSVQKRKFIWSTYSRSSWANKSWSSWLSCRTLVTSWALENKMCIKQSKEQLYSLSLPFNMANYFTIQV